MSTAFWIARGSESHQSTRQGHHREGIPLRPLPPDQVPPDGGLPQGFIAGAVAPFEEPSAAHDEGDGDGGVIGDLQ